MKSLTLNVAIATILGAATLCGCATDSPQATAPTRPAATLTPATPTADATPAAMAQRAPATEAEIADYVAGMRGDLSAGKVQTINAVMRLTADESARFWPIYQDYELELFELGDVRLGLIRRFAAAQVSGQIQPAEAATLAEEYFRFEQQQLDLKKKYHGLIAQAVSPVRAAQFAQIEHRVGTIIDLAIAAELPLIRSAQAVPSH